MSPSLFTPSADGGVSIVLDSTGSMEHMAQQLAASLAGHLVRLVAKGVRYDRFTLVAMGDHPQAPRPSRLPEAPFFTFGTTHNLEELVAWVRSMAEPLFHGGDGPEAWADALDAARLADPTGELWLVSDAYPHGMVNSFDAAPGCGSGDELIQVKYWGPESAQPTWREQRCGSVLRLDDVNLVVAARPVVDDLLPQAKSVTVLDSKNELIEHLDPDERRRKAALEEVEQLASEASYARNADELLGDPRRMVGERADGRALRGRGRGTLGRGGDAMSYERTILSTHLGDYAAWTAAGVVAALVSGGFVWYARR